MYDQEYNHTRSFKVKKSDFSLAIELALMRFIFYFLSIYLLVDKFFIKKTDLMFFLRNGLFVPTHH